MTERITASAKMDSRRKRLTLPIWCLCCLLEAARDALKSVARLLQQPFHHASRIVAIRDVIAQRRKTIWLAALLHFGELAQVKFLILDCTPVVARVIHGEARSQRAVGADDQPVLAGAAAPMLADRAHESFHVLRRGIESTIFQPWRCLSISQSRRSSTTGKSSGRIYVSFSCRCLKCPCSIIGAPSMWSVME